MNEKEIVLLNLKSNFKYIQDRINDIKSKEVINIKEISDLQRFVEMQLNIARTIEILEY